MEDVSCFLYFLCKICGLRFGGCFFSFIQFFHGVRPKTYFHKKYTSLGFQSTGHCKNLYLIETMAKSIINYSLSNTLAYMCIFSFAVIITNILCTFLNIHRNMTKYSTFCVQQSSYIQGFFCENTILNENNRFVKCKSIT